MSFFVCISFLFSSFPVCHESISVCIKVSSTESRLIFFFLHTFPLFFLWHIRYNWKKLLRQVCSFIRTLFCHLLVLTYSYVFFDIVKFWRFVRFIYICICTLDNKWQNSYSSLVFDLNALEFLNLWKIYIWKLDEFHVEQ